MFFQDGPSYPEEAAIATVSSTRSITLVFDVIQDGHF
jgi:hypothetical protein